MKMIIDIPDNELKVPLRNIHLLISNGIVGEVCIKKYDKNEPYFMNLNYTPLEECEDAISRQAVINSIANTNFWLSADNWNELISAINSVPPVTPIEKVGQWIKHSDESGKWYECDQCHTDWSGSVNYCPNCGVKMVEVEE